MLNRFDEHCYIGYGNLTQQRMEEFFRMDEFFVDAEVGFFKPTAVIA